MGVHFTGQFDKAGVYAVFACFPSQVERVDRDAVAAQAWTWVISNEAEWFGCSGIDDFVNVDTHFVGNNFHLVHQADVYGAVDVFQKFGQLGSFGGAYRNNFIDGRLVQRKADFQTGRGVAADDFWNGTGFKVRVTWVFTLRRVNQEHVLTDFQAAFFHARQQFFFGSAGVGGGFQRQHLTGAQVRFYRIGGVNHKAHVRLAVFVQRSRYAQNDGFYFVDAGEVGRCFKQAIGSSGNFVGRDMLDVAFAFVELVDFVGVNVEPQNLVTDIHIAQHQW